MQDLLAATPNAQTMTISAMVAHWLTDQQTGNIVLISKPNTTEEFVALPHVDGSPTVTYTAPPLSTVRLSQSLAGQITYLTKDGETLLFGPTPTGALQSWTFPNGMAVNLSYLFGPQLSVVTNSLGRSLTFSYNGNDVSSVTDDTGRSVAYGYDGNHNLVQATDPLGNTTNYVYDSSGMFDTQGHLTQIFNPSCPSYPFVTTWYDPLGRVNQQANGNGYSWSFYFAGSRSEIDDAVGNSHVTYQTDRGRVLLDARVLSGTADVFNDTVQQNGIVNVTTNQYDGLDRLTLTTLPEGGTTAFSYAGAVNPWANNIASIVSTAKPGSSLAPRTVSYTYDPVWNEATSVTDPLGLVATAAYDPATRNLLTAVADTASATAFNATSSFTYDAYGKPLSATDPLGIVTTFGYDAFENLVSQVVDSGAGHLNIRSQFGYDTLGNQIFQTDPNGNTTTMSYDANRRLVSMTAPAPYNGGAGLTQVTNGYDADGNVISIARANGTGSVVTRKTYSASSKLLSVTDPNGNTTMMSYDADDRIAGMIDPLFRTTSFSYDAMSRLVSTTNLAIQSTPLEQRSYSPDGLLASLTDANNHSTSYAYDGFDRLGTATYPDSSTEILGYDADSNILSFETRRSDTITFGYDTLNRRVTKTPPTPSPVVTYAWDLDGRPVGVSDTSASMTAVAAPGGTTAQYATATSYDQLNRPIGVTWTPAPTRTTPTASTVTFNHTYDATSRRIGQTANDNSYWSYPTSANAISYTTNNLSQYSAIGSVTPTYDGDGNLTYDGTFTYGYDSESRLTSLTGGGISGAYVYDAQGRRKEKTIGSTTTVYTTDAAGREILEYNGTTGAVQTWYAYGRGSNDVLNQMNVVAATRATLVPDIQGSIIASLPSGSTTPTKTGYQAYGENPSLTSGTFAYTAQRFDPETAGSTAEPSGLYYYRARMYSPSLGRFFQIDPIGYGGGGNLYAYVGNNPLNFVDPSGLVAQPGSGGGAVLGATAGIGHNGGPPLEEGIAEGESAAGAEAAELGLGIGLKAAAVAGIIVGAIVDPQTANQSENEFLSNWHANYATAYNFYINSGLSAADAQSHILGINLSLPVTVVSLPGGTPLIQYQTPGYAIGSYFASPGTPVNTLGIDPVGRVGINYVTSTNVQALQSTAAMTTGNPGLPSFAQGPGGGTQYYIPSKSVTPVN
jgi:RHS repeat-associated protein